MASVMMDFYEQLGITDRRCSQDEIRAAYKKTALKWHPGTFFFFFFSFFERDMGFCTTLMKKNTLKYLLRFQIETRTMLKWPQKGSKK
jgi:hypothetical protein